MLIIRPPGFPGGDHLLELFIRHVRIITEIFARHLAKPFQHKSKTLCVRKLCSLMKRIIGTMVGFSLQFGEDDNPVFIRKPGYFEPYNADENKVVRIRERGLLPSVFAFGNSSGDLAMLKMTAASHWPHMVCILEHDDPEREFEYHKSN